MSGRHHTHANAPATSSNPNANMTMSGGARSRMLATERIVMRYYNDMGKNRGNRTWGPGFLAHKGVCSAEELAKKVAAPSVVVEYARRVAEAERMVKRKVNVELNQAQCDALCSLTYNAGPTIAADVYRYVNQRDFGGAASAISQLVKAGLVEDGKKSMCSPPA